MNNWRYKLYQLMQGRYGIDDFGRFLLIGAMIAVMASNLRFLHGLYLPGAALAGYACFRIMSRNIYRRQRENQKYTELKSRFFAGKSRKNTGQRGSWNAWGGNFRSGNPGPGTGAGMENGSLSYNFYRCRSCGQTVRVPRGKGTLKITCPGCGNSFIDRT